jgi:hypothetical protein
VGSELRVFLDTSALFAAVSSELGGASLVLKLGEAGVVSLWVGPWVLREAESALARKSPRSKARFALLLDRARVHVGQEAGAKELKKALSVVGYLPDAQVVAEALTVGVDYFVSFDRKHLVGRPEMKGLPFEMGTAGDFLGWYRERLSLG